jgi:hypothetical protein
MFRGFVVVALVVAVMVTIKDGRALRETGLVGSCTAVVAPQGQAGFWEACRPGKLEGRPNLGRRSCKSAGLVGNVEYWQCPSRIEGGHQTG